MVNGEIEKKVHALRAKGHGMIKIAKAVGIGVGTVLRMVKAKPPQRPQLNRIQRKIKYFPRSLRHVFYCPDNLKPRKC